MTATTKKKKGTFPSKYFNTRNTTQMKKIGAMGGHAGKGSIAVKYAAQLREMRKRGKTNEQVAFFVKRLEDPTANVLHLQKLLEDVIDANPDCVQAINTLVGLHRAHFGEKRFVQSLNVNLDLVGELKDLDKHIFEVIKE